MSSPKPRLTDQEYAFVFERVPRLCLDFVIVKDKKVLLSKREIEPFKGCWHVPGGMVRRKESIDQAAERILNAELGLKPISKQLIGYMEFPDEVNQHGTEIHTISMVFLTILKEGIPRGSDQAQEIEYFDAIPELMHPGHKMFLDQNWINVMEFMES